MIKRYIPFEMLKEGQEETWNGYYRENRIQLKITETTWVVSVFENGYKIAAFINRKTDCSKIEINRLIEVGCYFVDQIKKWEE